MPEFQLQTPVAFIVFNRPDTTQRVFAEIAKARPPKLLVVGDGPRVNRPGEADKVAAVRGIIDQVDWPCEVLTNYSEINLGCKIRVSSGIDWVFEQVEEAIILEDDCLPDPTFFRYCEELLIRYRHDLRISMISGDNFQQGHSRTDSTYYFSRYNHIWGWASWRRAWMSYDRNMQSWPAFRKAGWSEVILSGDGERKYWTEIFNSVHEGRIDTWDYQWLFASWMNRMVSIMPNKNLISNIGFGAGATHTTGPSIYANMAISPVDYPMLHPTVVLTNKAADDFTAAEMFSSSLLRRLVRRALSVIRRYVAL